MSFSFAVWMLFAAIGLLAAGVVLLPRRFGFDPLPPCPGSGPPRPCAAGEPVPPAGPGAPPASRFPLHGKLGLTLLLASWILAWSRVDLPGIAEQHTFFPLWLGFIFTLDGLVFRRTGRSLWKNCRPAFLLMFPVSALSWWYFEFLNRFVQNWWYPDRLDFGPVHYIVYSSLCFSTVLPGVFEMHDLLASFPALRNRWSRGPHWRFPHAAAAFAALGAILLPLIPRFPDPLFFATWVAPLALLAGALGLAGVETPFQPIARGDWSPAIRLALAALACGFFWELWNFWSAPHWEYAVPYVNRFRLFEMPAVGFTGYLPFGPVCACFWLAWTACFAGRVQGPGFRVQPDRVRLP